MSRLVWSLVACLCLVAARAELVVGDRLPDCAKVPLVSVDSRYQPDPGLVPSIEKLLPAEGLLLLHFSTPRPRPGAGFPPILIDEVTAVGKALLSAPYPCVGAVVLPFGQKSAEDYATLAAAAERADGEPAYRDSVPVFFEPTYPYPGLYRTFRPEGPIVTPLTAIISADRTILALRGPNEGGNLYDWLVASLPAELPAAVRQPEADIDLAEPGPTSWPVFRRTVRREAAARREPDRLPYFHVAWTARCGRTFASPVVAGDRVYQATEDAGLVALNLRTGVVGQRFGDSSWWTTPVLTADSIIGIDDSGTVRAVNRTDGRELWICRLFSLVTSSPALADGRLIVGTRRGEVVALDASTGEVLWRTQTGGEISSSPALADGLVLIGSGDRRLYALAAADGAVRWRMETGGAVDSSPTVAGDEVIVGSFDGALYCAGLADGAPRWTCRLGGWVHSSPAVRDDLVYVGTVPIAADDVPRFCWIDRATGAVRAEFRMPGAVYSSPTVWEDLVLVGCRDNQLYAFDATGRRTQPVWTFRTRSYVHASPVVVGDTILVASYDRHVYALRQDKPIAIWTEDDTVPRWFVAALARELHRGGEGLVDQAARGDVGDVVRLPRFDELFARVRGEAGAGTTVTRTLPRDVPGEHPGAPFVEYVLAAGLLGGFPDGSFQPSQPTTRYQFSGALNAVLDNVLRPDFAWRALQAGGHGDIAVEVTIESSADRPPAEPIDVDAGHWAYEGLRELGGRGLLVLDDEGRFRGDRVVTIADAAAQWNRIAEAVAVKRTR